MTKNKKNGAVDRVLNFFFAPIIPERFGSSARRVNINKHL
jgi:hypothetical protein